MGGETSCLIVAATAGINGLTNLLESAPQAAQAYSRGAEECKQSHGSSQQPSTDACKTAHKSGQAGQCAKHCV